MFKPHSIIIVLVALSLLSACITPGARDALSATGAPTWTVRQPTAALTITPTMAHLETGKAPITPDSAAKVELLRKINGFRGRIWTMAFSGDGNYFASTDQNNINLRDAASGEQAFTLVGQELNFNSIVFSPDSRLLATGQAIWDMESRQMVHRLDSLGWHPAFSADGAWLAVSGEQPIKIWDVASGQLVRTFETQADNNSFSIAFSPDGKLLADSGRDGKLRLWDVSSGQLIRTLAHGTQGDVHDIAFSPDGQLLVSASTDYTARLWDVASGQVLHTMRHASGLYGVAFSPDGKLVASASCDRTVRLWDAASGRTLRTLNHADEVTAVAFSPDGTQLASAAYDQKIYLWAIP